MKSPANCSSFKSIYVCNEIFGARQIFRTFKHILAIAGTPVLPLTPYSYLAFSGYFPHHHTVKSWMWISIEPWYTILLISTTRCWHFCKKFTALCYIDLCSKPFLAVFLIPLSWDKLAKANFWQFSAFHK